MAGKKKAKHGKKISEAEQQQIAEQVEMEGHRLSHVSDLFYTARTVIEQAENTIVDLDSPDMCALWDRLYELRKEVEDVHAKIIMLKFVRE